MNGLILNFTNRSARPELQRREPSRTQRDGPLQILRLRRPTQTLKRDKVSLDIFWLKDDSLENSANLPDPDRVARNHSP